MGITVSELAEAAGAATDPSVLGESRPPAVPPRAGNGYRTYDPDTTERLRFIRSGQRAGIRLRDIRELLDIRDHGTCPCGHTQQVLGRRIAEVELELARLEALRRTRGPPPDQRHLPPRPEGALALPRPPHRLGKR